MPVNVYYDDNYMRHISVLGNLITEDDNIKLLEVLSMDNMNANIIFVDQNILPENIISKLGSKQRASNTIRIEVIKRNLYSYLSGLGIKCRHIQRKTMDYNCRVWNRQKTEDIVLSTNKVYDFLVKLNLRYGYDYSEYQVESLMRRIKISMLREGIWDFEVFSELTLNNSEIFEQLFLDFSINTTEFFRDAEVFQKIKEKLLPYLNSFPYIRILCAGCSNGKEPYSMAILLHEMGMLDKSRIYATDINPCIIEEAKNGLFSMYNLCKEIKSYRIAGGKGSFGDCFDFLGGYMKIKSEYRKNVLFFQHSLLESGLLNEFQLILCRNVLIYFNCGLQKKVLHNFYESLDRRGFLVLGKSEGLLKNEGYEYFDDYCVKEKIFRRKHSNDAARQS